MAELLNRQFSLSVGEVGIATSRPVESGINPSLRIVFKITKSTQPEPNTADIEVWNLAKESRALVDGTKVPVRLLVGYGTELFFLFGGDVLHAASQKQGVDWVTKLHLQDGGKKYRGSRINVSLAPGTPLADALQIAASAIGLPVGNLGTHLTNIRGGLEKFSKGLVLSGKAEEEFDKLAQASGYEWSIQDGQLQVLGPNELAPGQSVLLSPDSGLIGTPEVGDKGLLKARSLLQPGLTPGRLVVMDSNSVKGNYRIQKASYSGDSHGQDWYADIEGTPLK